MMAPAMRSIQIFDRTYAARGRPVEKRTATTEYQEVSTNKISGGKAM
jgi:hypothetical protein